jgi:hypothetical protein
MFRETGQSLSRASHHVARNLGDDTLPVTLGTGTVPANMSFPKPSPTS